MFSGRSSEDSKASRAIDNDTIDSYAGASAPYSAPYTCIRVAPRRGSSLIMEQHSDASSSSLLVLAQVDHASGDIIATVIDRICDLGAKNVHLVPSLTKKGRPGYLLFLDLPASLLDEVSTVLAIELGVLGLRVLKNEHRPIPFVGTEQAVAIDLGGAEVNVNVPVKLFSTPRGPVPASVEHDFCVRLQQQLREEHGMEISLQVLKASILAAASAAGDNSRDGVASRGLSVNKEKEGKD